MMKKIKVVAAVIFWNDLILCVQRPKNNLLYISEKFEFPGGKIENGETNEDALHRELLEELSISAKINNPPANIKLPCIRQPPAPIRIILFTRLT